MRAAIDGAIEVGTPVVFSIMTSVAAFMPLFFIEGMMGKFMSVIPVIVIAVLLLSLVESLFILPAHLSSKGDGIVSRAFDRLFRRPLAFHSRIAQSFDRGLKRFIGSIYQPTLRLALANPLSTTALAYALMMFTVGPVAGGHVKFVFMPKIESDWLTVSVNMPQGTTVDQTTKIVELIEKKSLATAGRNRRRKRRKRFDISQRFHVYRRSAHGPTLFYDSHGRGKWARPLRRGHHRTQTG